MSKVKEVNSGFDFFQKKFLKEFKKTPQYKKIIESGIDSSITNDEFSEGEKYQLKEELEDLTYRFFIFQLMDEAEKDIKKQLGGLDDEYQEEVDNQLSHNYKEMHEIGNDI